MDQKERESTTKQADLSPETGAEAAQERPAVAGASVEDLQRRPKTLQALQRETAELFEEARHHPASDAALMVRVFILDGLLNMEEPGEGEESQGARLEAREIKKKLEKPVKSLEDMRQMVYQKFFEIVGVRPSAEEAAQQRERERQADESNEKDSS